MGDDGAREEGGGSFIRLSLWGGWVDTEQVVRRIRSGEWVKMG